MFKITYYLKKYWYVYTFAFICILAAVFLDMLSPQVSKHIVDDVIKDGQTHLLPRFLLIILGIGVGRCIFSYMKELTMDVISSKIGSLIRKQLFNHIQSLSTSFFDKNNTGELMSRVKDDVDRLWAAFGYVSMLIIEVIVHTTIALVFMYRLSPVLSIIPMIILPLVALLAILMERKLGRIYERISAENAKLNTVAQENLSGIRTVKAFTREKYEIKKFLSHNKRYYDLNMKQSKVFIKIYPYFQLITKLLPILVIIVGGYQLTNNKMSIGELTAFIEYSMNIVWPMEMLGWLSNDMSAAAASYKRIKKIFSEKPDIIEKPDPIILPSVNGSIQFKNVSLIIDNIPILTDINFKLDAGKTIGIMGATGTGKSSIINILQRFFDVNEGEILLDNTNIKDLSLNQLRKNISLVMQDVFLFSNTINENVKMGKRNYIIEKEVIGAATDAQARRFIERMDNKYETLVGERGVGLSGGQKQRISIARALAKNNPILILDDSTSALDMETEHMIQRALMDVNATKIIIAHRISAVKNADEIIILDGGRISERGTHETLLSIKGYYYKTYIAQYGNYLMDENNGEVLTCQ